MSTMMKKNRIGYKIGEAAEILGISIHTIRMYEKEGLILPNKNSSNQRIYTEKDLQRIQCIRSAINESKISIRGLKTLYSMIPCWEIVQCSEEDRKICPAYISTSKPCWISKGNTTSCAEKDCRECEVYKYLSDCKMIKEVIKKTRRVG